MDSRLKKAMEAEAAKDTADALRELLPRVKRIEGQLAEVLELLRRELVPVGSGKHSDRGGF